MAVRQLKDGRWICYYRDRATKQQRREYFGRGPEGEAAARARDNGLPLMNRRPRSATGGTGPDFFDCSDIYIRSGNFNENSKKHLLIRLEKNIWPVIGHRPAMRLNDTDLDRYVAGRRSAGVKNSTIRRELTDIMAILNHAARRRPPLIPFNPVRDYPKPPADDDIIIPPDQAETMAIINAASAHLKRALLIAYYTGLRPGAVELLRLKWSDVSWESGTIMIVSAKKGGPGIRQVPLNPEFLKTMKDWRDHDQNKNGPIIHYHGRQIKKIQKSWAGALSRAGITRRIRPYDLRHKFVTDALERGTDIKTLSEIVGSSPKTLMTHYQHVSNKMRKTAVETIPVLPICDQNEVRQKKKSKRKQ